MSRAKRLGYGYNYIDTLYEYERELRQCAEICLGIKIPDIPCVIDIRVQIIFLERLFHCNGLGRVEQILWEKYGKRLSKDFSYKRWMVN